MRKAVEYEIRLAYYDRIARTLPEDFQDPEAQIIPDKAPGPDYEYDDPGACRLSLDRGVESLSVTFDSPPLSRRCSIRSRFAAWPLKTGRRNERPRISQELISREHTRYGKPR